MEKKTSVGQSVKPVCVEVCLSDKTNGGTLVCMHVLLTTAFVGLTRKYNVDADFFHNMFNQNLITRPVQ